MNITSITAKLKIEPKERRVSVTGLAQWGKIGSESRCISGAAHLTCLCGAFSDACRLLEEVRDCGLADLQVVGSVRLRRQKSYNLNVAKGGHVNMRYSWNYNLCQKWNAATI